eukprot:1738427-Rhodomonas_salina.1
MQFGRSVLANACGVFAGIDAHWLERTRAAVRYGATHTWCAHGGAEVCGGVCAQTPKDKSGNKLPAREEKRRILTLMHIPDENYKVRLALRAATLSV